MSLTMKRYGRGGTLRSLRSPATIRTRISSRRWCLYAGMLDVAGDQGANIGRAFDDAISAAAPVIGIKP
jgi:hypothetical protein